MPSPWTARALAVAAAFVGAGCGRSDLDQAYPVSVDVAKDAGSTADAARPTSPVDAAGHLPDAAKPALVGCAGALRCRNGAGEACGDDGVWVSYTLALCDRPTSCQSPGTGISDCGPEQEDCCTTINVPGGDYVRSYDGVSCPGGPNAGPAPALGCYTSPDHPATVSGFRLDKYLVTVARYRLYLASIRSTGWRPPAGSGRHDHLSFGRGLTDVGVGAPGTFETGWNPAWSTDALIEEPRDDGNTIPNIPISVTWSQAYAFCIWDGGFLPSEAEWNYVAAGGAEQRVYPWSRPPQDQTVTCKDAAYTELSNPNACPESAAYWVGAKSPAGDGRWGHADMAGGRSEWTLDWLRDYVDPCVDCVNLQEPDSAHRTTTTSSHAVRGYSRVGPTAPLGLLTSLRGDDSYGGVGFRCAREPLEILAL